ncbi:MAG: hypothetical protein OHK93_003044 [Ramalina farinacea]|uniref:Peptidase A1 domain-containing protein n=1 Tax=Ramalina farinacea TaxID=258253 RepID=A0AA43QSJ1_9LECA|nr:hypothetical protein [Ramalina farinacea]
MAIKFGYLSRKAAFPGFQKNKSSTWSSQGIFDLDVENGLNLTGNGDFGYDTIGLDIQNSGGLTLTHQLLGGIATKDFYLGEFGLGPKPTNLSSFDNPIPNYMRTLREQNLIPSISYGYTAGAKYQLDGVFGSLTLGGFDATRFIPSNLSLPFAADDSRSLTVGVQSIILSSTSAGEMNALTKGAFFLLDSSVSDLWLPLSACQVFEEAFGLTYDGRTDFYTVNASTHQRLQNLNPSVTLKLGAVVFGESTISITLPYAAFDLQASSPYYPNATNYFPVRRAANSTQYILGRTIFQETYIIVDQERSNFTIAQALFQESAQPKLVTIQPLNTSSSSATKHDIENGGHSISHGVLATIIVVVVLFLFLVTGSGIYFYRRKHRSHQIKPPSPELDSAQMESHLGELDSEAMPTAEFEGDINHRPEVEGERGQRIELEGERGRKTELEDTLRQRSELEGGMSQWPELEGTTPMAATNLNRREVYSILPPTQGQVVHD